MHTTVHSMYALVHGVEAVMLLPIPTTTFFLYQCPQRPQQDRRRRRRKTTAAKLLQCSKACACYALLCSFYCLCVQCRRRLPSLCVPLSTATATPRRWRLSANSLNTKLSRRVSDNGLTLLLLQCFLLDEAAWLLRSRIL